MIFRRRVSYFVAVLMGAALPVWANNPPRPDGVLYLILVFPLLALAGHLAEAVPYESSTAGKVGRGLFFTFVILASAAGTEIGFLAVLVIMVYGIVRSYRISERGVGRKRFIYATIAFLGTLAAGFGYLWAVSSMNSHVMKRAKQKRTMSDMRTISTALMTWSLDQRAGEATTITVAADAPNDTPETAVFLDSEGPPIASAAQLKELLEPDYIRLLPEVDAWSNPFEVRLDLETHQFLIRSGGANGAFESNTYNEGSFDQEDHNHDIVAADGMFICWPESRQNPNP